MTKTDLRVQRTINIIDQAFKELLCKMEYEEITVTELAKQAQINRKTFYLHYNNLDDLLKKLQNVLVVNFVQRIKDYQQLKDMKKITEAFFLTVFELGVLGERLVCNSNYQYIAHKINKDILAQTWNSNRFKLSGDIEGLVMVFVCQSTLEIYRKWVIDGKKISMDTVIELTANLISNGLNGLK